MYVQCIYFYTLFTNYFNFKSFLSYFTFLKHLSRLQLVRSLVYPHSFTTAAGFLASDCIVRLFGRKTA